MYKIYADDELICDSRIDDLAVIEPSIELEANTAGLFSFTMPPEHPRRDLIQKWKTVVSVYKDDKSEPEFQGVCKSVQEDFYNQRKFSCEGELTYLNDSIQRPQLMKNATILEFLSTMIANHNAQTEDRKHFAIGLVTVSDTSDLHDYCTGMNTTMKEIKTSLVDVYGGYMRVRYADGVKYIDYLEGAARTSNQTIELGKNLTDYTSNIDNTDIATVIIPYGKKLETEEGQADRFVTIESVNEGRDYLENAAAVETFGKIAKSIQWQSEDDPEVLMDLGMKYLQEIQFDNVVISASALDLGNLTGRVNNFRLLDNIHVISPIHGMNRYFMLTKLSMKLNNPESDRVVLGETTKKSLTTQSSNANAKILEKINSIPSEDNIIKQAVDQATNMIAGADGGFIVVDIDEETKKPFRILVMDVAEKELATNVIQINKNGIGFSTNGINGPYTNAWTIDGQLVADFIKSGTMYADRIKGGTLKLGGADDIDGKIEMYDASGKKIGEWTSHGMRIGLGDWGFITAKNSEGECILINEKGIYFSKDIGDTSISYGSITMFGGHMSINGDSIAFNQQIGYTGSVQVPGQYGLSHSLTFKDGICTSII